MKKSTKEASKDIKEGQKEAKKDIEEKSKEIKKIVKKNADKAEITKVIDDSKKANAEDSGEKKHVIRRKLIKKK